MTSESILFITRNYPPKVGGLETYSFNLIEAFISRMKTCKITLSKSKKHLIWFFPKSLFEALFVIRKFSVSHVHLCDGSLAPLGLILKSLSDVKTSITIHGLDITFSNFVYQKLIPRSVEKMDRIVCVSRATREEVKKRVSLSSQSCAVIPNGIIPDEMFLKSPKLELQKRFESATGLKLTRQKKLFTIGHLVKRKGVAWFVANVMPKLPSDYSYLVAGEGPERVAIECAVATHRLEKRVFLLGEISDELRNVLYNLSDIFVMPNITVPSDVEGFGIVALEAGSCGLPVVATNIQGLRDAVIEGKTGFLITEGYVQGFVERIKNMSLKKENVRICLNETFAWSRIFRDYRNFLFS